MSCSSELGRLSSLHTEISRFSLSGRGLHSSTLHGTAAWTYTYNKRFCLQKSFCSFEPRSGVSVPRMYECGWYRAVFTVRRQSSYVRSSRVFIPVYCTVGTPSPRPISTPRLDVKEWERPQPGDTDLTHNVYRIWSISNGRKLMLNTYVGGVWTYYSDQLLPSPRQGPVRKWPRPRPRLPRLRKVRF
ncbi:hypothetical protein EVAR_95081_1 [Eumeta japonica]|uniref:Uncharacterized protein n=1 Tax=Eumeta variegata TaxID=151549 RepID=A0A4C1W7Z1_EUMVA|nr:hypothetical protein EVAR_95081_1 [Eumeta japonica]